MLKLGVGAPTTVVEAGEGFALSLAHPRLRAHAMKSAEGRALTRAVGRMLADGDVTMAEPQFNATDHHLIDSEDFDGFAAFAPQNGSPSVVGKYPTGRLNFDGQVGEKVFGLDGEQEMEDEGVATLVTGRGGTGKALRLKYGGVGGIDDCIIGPRAAETGEIGGLGGGLPEVAGPYDHFFFSCWFRTSSGANPDDSDSASVKGFMFWETSEGRIEWRPCGVRNFSSLGSSRWDGTHGDNDHTRWQPGGGWPENGESGEDYWQGAQDESFGAGNPDSEPGYPPSWSPEGAGNVGNHNDGEWHRFTIEIRSGSSFSAAEKGMRLWIDGEYVFDDVGRVPSIVDVWGHGIGKNWIGSDLAGGLGYTHANPTDGFQVWGNYVTGAAALASTQFTIDFDDWIAWTPK